MTKGKMIQMLTEVYNDLGKLQHDEITRMALGDINQAKFDKAMYDVKDVADALCNDSTEEAPAQQCSFCPLTHGQYRFHHEAIAPKKSPCKHDRHIYELKNGTKVCADCGEHNPVVPEEK